MGVRRLANRSVGRACDIESNAPRLSIQQEHPPKDGEQAHRVARRPLFCWEDSRDRHYEAWGQLFMRDTETRFAVLLTCPYWEAVPDEVANDDLFKKLCGADADSLVTLKPKAIPQRTGRFKNLLDAFGEYYLLDVVARAQLAGKQLPGSIRVNVPGTKSIRFNLYVEREVADVTGVTVIYRADNGKAFATARVVDEDMRDLLAKAGAFRNPAYDTLRDHVIGQWWRRAVETGTLDLDKTRPRLLFNPLTKEPNLPDLSTKATAGQAAFGLVYGDGPAGAVDKIQWVWIASGGEKSAGTRQVRLSSRRLSKREKRRLFALLSVDTPRLRYNGDVKLVITREEQRDAIEIAAYIPDGAPEAPGGDEVRLTIAPLADAITLSRGDALKPRPLDNRTLKRRERGTQCGTMQELAAVVAKAHEASAPGEPVPIDFSELLKNPSGLAERLAQDPIDALLETKAERKCGGS